MYKYILYEKKWPHNIGTRPIVLQPKVNANNRNYLFLCNGKSTRAHHFSRLIGAAHCGKLSTHAPTITNNNDLYHARNKVHCGVVVGVRKRVTESNSGKETAIERNAISCCIKIVERGSITELALELPLWSEIVQCSWT